MKKTTRVSIPPFILVGAFLIILPITVFIIFQNINRQKAHTHFLQLEKGAALIRSFEAGTRAGMRGRAFGLRKLQQLLSETAQQPDILYIIVTDEQGNILAHNDDTLIGGIHGKDLNLPEIANRSELDWKIRKGSQDRRIFEVFRQFRPSGKIGNPEMFGRMMRFNSNRPGHMFPPPKTKQVIFIGLDMYSLDEADDAVYMNSIVTGTLLFLIGTAGIVLLFLFQNYRQTQTSLTEIKAFSDILVNNMPVGLLALDREQKVSSLNTPALQILGRSEESIVGLHISRIFPNFVTELMEKLEQEPRILGEEIQWEKGENKVVPLELNLSLIRDANEEPNGFAILFKDLSEIHRLRSEIARSQHMASIGRLAAGVAHEIRNPLSSIKGFATYFKQRYQDVAGDQETATIMINEIDRLDRVVSQLLELSRPIKIMPQQTTINEFVQTSTRLIEQKARDYHIDIRMELPKNSKKIHLDRDKISQVLLNIYLNAIDAMEKGGDLIISSLPEEGSNSVKIIIEDSGKGISSERLPKIFDPYFTTKSTGTGLGLAVVHNILEAHQGKVEVESKLEKGTRFTLTIPDLNPGELNEG